jgi:nucleotide-binding universal stress UspA family protein
MGLACSVTQVHDVPHKGVVHIAEQEKCDLILVGSHGKTLAQEVLLGSVSENVVRHATMPVLLVKLRVVTEMGKKVCKFTCEKMPRKVLVPTDFSDCANEALELVRGLRNAGVEELVLDHVQDVRKLRPHLAARMKEFNEVDRQRLETLQQRLTSDGFHVRIRLSEGVPFQEILRVADEEDVGLIALCSHGRTALAEVLLGSVSEQVIRRAAQAVLLVPCSKVCMSGPKQETTG